MDAYWHPYYVCTPVIPEKKSAGGHTYNWASSSISDSENGLRTFSPKRKIKRQQQQI